jgi:hypothetical protein
MRDRDAPQRQAEVAKMIRAVLPMMLGMGARGAAPTMTKPTKRKRKG